MSLTMGVLGIIILMLVYKFLDDAFTLLLYGSFMIYATLNFDTYFNMGATAAEIIPFQVVSGLLTALTFMKMIYFSGKFKDSSILRGLYES